MTDREMWQSQYLCRPEPTEKDRKMHELAARYVDLTERYDREICTGPILDGAVMPATPHERRLTLIHARARWQEVMAEAARCGITDGDLRRTCDTVRKAIGSSSARATIRF